MPLGVCLAVLALLVAGSVAFGAGNGGGSEGASSAPTASIPTIARRVEKIRGLRFRKLPKPVRVGGAQARREGLADLDRTYPVADRRADEELYKLLGLLRPRDDLRKIAASIFGSQVAGYYDPRTGALRIVDTGAPANRVVDETTLAHELTHALEDQVYDLDLDDIESTGDRALAYAALVEGTATALMTEYQSLHFGAEEALGGIAASAFGAPSLDSLPPFVTAQLLFPYLDGERFVSRLYATGSDTWRVVDVAENARPPASTEQILHPDAYLKVEQPVRVRLEGIGEVLGPEWSRVATETFGEWQTREWLRNAGGNKAGEAAGGWGGDRYELWRQGSIEARDCRAPCTERDVLVMEWAWDTPRDAAEFRAALPGAIEEGMSAEPVGEGRWTLRGGGIAVASSGDRRVTIAFAPGVALAHRLARHQ